jgi:dTMP kinase
MPKTKGWFITFEGPEGSGKSTAIRAAAAFFKRAGFKVTILREPGGTLIGEKIRKILLDRSHNRMTLEAELLLYLASRAQIVREKILPALRKRRVVLCDRYHDSTLVYQGYAGGLSLKQIEIFGRFVKQEAEPDLTLLLDVSAREGLKRGRRRDRMEKKPLYFHEKVRNGFLALAGKYSGRMLVVPDAKDVKQKMILVENALQRFLKRTRS